MAAKRGFTGVRQRPTYATQWLRSFANIIPNLASTALQSTVQGLISDQLSGRQQQRALEGQQVLAEDTRAAAEQAAQQRRMHETEMGIRGREAEKESDLIGTLAQSFGLAGEPETAAEIMTKGQEFRRPTPLVPQETTQISGTAIPTFGALPEEPPKPLGFQESVQEAMSGWSPGQRKEASGAWGKTPGRDWMQLARLKGQQRMEQLEKQQAGREALVPMRGGEARKTVGLRGEIAGKLGEQEAGIGAEAERQRVRARHPAVKYGVEPGYEPKAVPYEPPGPGGERRGGYVPGQAAPAAPPSPKEPAGSAKQALEGMLNRNPKWARLKRSNPELYEQKIQAMLANPGQFGME